MKILLAHNFYQQPGGEDMVYSNEKRLLESMGHTVIPFIRKNSENRSIDQKISGACNMLWSHQTTHKLEELIHLTQPDIAHFHNTFFTISPSAYYACNRAGIPVVQTLHNYRLICPNALLMRENTICEECLDSAFALPGIIHACWHDSHIQSANVAAMLAMHRTLGTWRGKIDCYIALTEFARQKFITGGLPAEKIVVKPNFVDRGSENRQNTQDYVLFVGRLSTEKGLNTMIRAWKQLSEIPLKIVGAGPSMNAIEMQIEKEGLRHIELLGTRSHNQVIELIHSARFMIFPSECYETFGMVIIEAFACGTPVIASRLGAMEELVRDKSTGLLFNPGDADDMTKKVKILWSNPGMCIEMGKNAKIEYTSKYSAEKNYITLMSIYQKVIAKKKDGRNH